MLGATIVSRWFVAGRGLIMGLAAIAQHSWRQVVLLIALVTGLIIPLALMFLPEGPADIGLTPYGGPPGQASCTVQRTNPLSNALQVLARASRVGDFWLLIGTSFTTDTFGDRDGPIVFGWIAAWHQIGAASAAFFAGLCAHSRAPMWMRS